MGVSLVITGYLGSKTIDSVIKSLRKHTQEEGDLEWGFHCGNVYNFMGFGCEKNACAWALS